MMTIINCPEELLSDLAVQLSPELLLSSAAQVKAEAAELIETCAPGPFRAYVNLAKKGARITEIMQAWKQKQEELRKQSMQDQDIANLAVDRRQNNDLDTLKLMSGPLTSAAAVGQYTSGNIDKNAKLKSLYLDVRYARDTFLSLPKTSDLLRLIKDHKKLPLSTYAANIKLYLNNVTFNTDATIDYLSKVMDTLLNPMSENILCWRIMMRLDASFSSHESTHEDSFAYASC